MILSLGILNLFMDGQPENHMHLFLFCGSVKLYVQNNFLKLLQDIYVHAETDEILDVLESYQDYLDHS